ncbi:hypothetical protein [Ancylobacter crimeensis]|nr:hypothetical protein [Ancylobacter crimeensis]
MPAHARYLLVRPRGGMNDCLVQIHRCRRYAAAHDRIVLLDLSRGAMRVPFDTLFRVLPEASCRLETADDALLAALDTPGAVRPASLCSQLAGFEPSWCTKHENYVDEAGAPVTFDMTRDHPERCLVHEQCGGGLIGARGLEGLALAPDIAGEVVERLARLGAVYDALHVRHSDYRTDFQQLFARARPMFAGQRLLLCTDSAEVQQVARRFFPPQVDLITNMDVPESDEPLHYRPATDIRAAAIDQFCDLIAMARARRYLFTTLDTVAIISGFSALVEGLRAAPAIPERLLSLAPNHALLGATHPMPRRQLPLSRRLARIAALMAEPIWNRRARRRRRRVRRAVLRAG